MRSSRIPPCAGRSSRRRVRAVCAVAAAVCTGPPWTSAPGPIQASAAMPTSTETPIERRSGDTVSWATRQTSEPAGFSSAAGRSPWRAITASSRASRSGRSPTGSVALRRRSRHVSTIRPARRRGLSSCATWGVPTLRGVHAAAEREGRCLRVLQGLPSRRDRVSLDSRAGARRDEDVVRALRSAADVV